MADFYEGYYDATVAGTEWVKAWKGTVGLRVDVTVRNAEGDTKAMSGTIWMTPRTMKSPGRRDDGTPKRSAAERQLNAVGYTGPLSGAHAIGRTIDVRGNATRVQLKNETYKDETRLKVAWFVLEDDRERRGLKPATEAQVQAALGAPEPEPPDDDEESLDGDIPF